jgi:glycosyltransferase involved in cell wall biosynthesis
MSRGSSADERAPGAAVKLSAIIITRNEAANIAACLASVAFCDERIVVDAESTDDTAAIAAAVGATVVGRAWTGFGPQKNAALALAQGDWVLSIDADERVPPPLAAEIVAAIAAPQTAPDAGPDAYAFPRLSTFLGRTMRHSGWYPDYVVRLFRRGRARFSDDLVHERVVCAGAVGRLATPLEHHPVLRIEDAIRRIDTYSTAGAAMLGASGRRISFASGITHGIWSFLRAYIWRRGFLDGREGFLLAVANAEGTYYRYMKAWLAGRRRE